VIHHLVPRGEKIDGVQKVRVCVETNGWKRRERSILLLGMIDGKKKREKEKIHAKENVGGMDHFLKTLVKTGVWHHQSIERRILRHEETENGVTNGVQKTSHMKGVVRNGLGLIKKMDFVGNMLLR
jgi:hypothetical protein